MTPQEIIKSYYDSNDKDSYYFELRALAQERAEKMREIVARVSGEEIGPYDYSVLMRGEDGGFEVEWFRFEHKQFFPFEELCEFDEENYARWFRNFLLVFKKEELCELSEKMFGLESEIERLENFI